MTTSLNEEQRLAVRTPVGPTLVPAGPGSGKTRVATERIVWLVSEFHADPASILAFTFTNRAARELRSRIAARLSPDEANALFAGTFHAWGARFLRRYHQQADLDQNFSIYDQDDSLETVKQVIDLLELDFDNPAAEARHLLNSISKAKSDNTDNARELRRWRSELEQPNPSRRAVEALVHHHYDRLLRENNAVDFDDLIIMPLRILSQHQDVSSAVHRSIRHVIVDEYQDTSHSQHLLVAAIINYPDNARPSIYAVGDADQAIYSFRNADVDNIIQFADTHYQDSKERHLRTNYRSTPQIVNAAQSLIEHNQRRIDRYSTPATGDGPRIAWYQANNPEQEAKQIAHLIQRLRDEHQQDLQQCCVIYRTNPQSRSLEEALRATPIPYQVAGNFEFFARAEIKRHIDYLNLAANPLDATRLRRVANLPPRGLGPKSMEAIEAYAQEREIQLRSAFRELAETPHHLLAKAATEGIIRFDHHLTTLSEMARDQSTIPALIDYVSQECELLRYFSAHNDGDSKAANIAELRAIADQMPGIDIREFLERTAMDSQDHQSQIGRVTLATIHQTKGLEFDVVFIAGAEEGLIPHRRSVFKQDDIEEERRLMYVAMTRARHRLIITWCRHRSNSSSATIQRSRFIDEIDPQFWHKPLPDRR